MNDNVESNHECRFYALNQTLSIPSYMYFTYITYLL